MNPVSLIVNILAVGLTLSQLFTRPVDQFKTQFNLQSDQKEIQELLHSGCSAVTNELNAGGLDLDLFVSIIVSSIDDEKKKAAAEAAKPAAANAVVPVKTFFRKMAEKIEPDSLMAAYHQFCKNETGESLPHKPDEVVPFFNKSLRMEEVIAYFNKTMENLPDHTTLKNKKLKESSLLLDRDGNRFTEIYAEDNRRKWIPLAEIPEHVKQAFIAAEDQRFRDHDLKDKDGKVTEHVVGHHGVDLGGVVRAFQSGFASKDRPQGGSTITQQVVKNLLVGNDVSYERKIREMIMAARLETVLSKDEILELYLNQVFLGRTSWGIEMASQSYFGKSARDLDVAEAAFLAVLNRGPNAYNPDRFPEKMLKQRRYVLGRMNDDQYLSDSDYKKAMAENVTTIPFVSPNDRSAFYFIDEIQRDAKRLAKIDSLTSSSYVVRSTIHPELQKSAEMALQDGLSDFEIASNRTGRFQIPGSLADNLEKYQTTWQEALPKVRGSLYDVHWPLAVVLDTGSQSVIRKKGKRSSGSVIVGLADGTTVPLECPNKLMLKKLKVYDLVYVTLEEDDSGTTATLRVQPKAQGAIVVMEAKTGRVLAMSGGFSYPASPLNRATRMIRPPGSTLKPFIYLSALNLNFQPNTLIPNVPRTLPPLHRGGHSWSPHNYDRSAGGLVTIRHAVEQSLNIPTVNLMSELGQTPAEGLDYIGSIVQDLGIYQNPIREYPFVLGVQETRLLDMAVAYSTVANIGLKPKAHFIDSIEKDGKMVYEWPRFDLEKAKADRIAFYQIRHILEGTVERGTAVKMKDLAGYVAGKTGTSSDWKDAWFAGFTNDLVVISWVGYDTPATLGSSNTGGKLALPIAEKVIRDSFILRPFGKDKELLSGPPPEIRSQIAQININPKNGHFNEGNYPEIFRLDGQTPWRTEMSLLKPEDQYLASQPSSDEGDGDDGGYSDDGGDPDVVTRMRGQQPQSDGEAYRPGASDPYDMWQRNGNRVVAPEFAGRPEFYNY